MVIVSGPSYFVFLGFCLFGVQLLIDLFAKLFPNPHRSCSGLSEYPVRTLDTPRPLRSNHPAAAQ